MLVNIHEAKTKLSALVERVENGGEVTIARRGVPVARLVANTHPHPKRIGGLAGRHYRFGEGFDAPSGNASIIREFDESTEK